jgi:peptide/nickel transport system substrate-binding protein
MEKIRADKKLKSSKITEIGYQGITINIAKSDRAQQNPLGRDARVREAFELSLDRQGLAQVVMDNEATVSATSGSRRPISFYAKSMPVPKRDVARARQLLKEAGVTNPSFTLMTATTSDAQRLALVIQAMSATPGFDVKIQSTEFATSLNLADKGDFDAYILAWSGRADPDGNLYSFHGCKQPLNYSGYCKRRDRRAAQQSRTKCVTLPTARRCSSRWPPGDQGAPGDLPVPPQLAVGLQQQADRRARDAGWPAAPLEGLKLN